VAFSEGLQTLLALAGATAVAFGLDRATVRRGLDPPGFAQPGRRAAVLALFAGCFALTLFLPLVSFGQAAPAEALEPAERSLPSLFFVHALLAGLVLAWLALGFGRPGGAGLSFGLALRQVGLRSVRPWEDLLIGAAGSVGTYACLLGAAMIIGVFTLLFGDDLVPQQVPEVVGWLAAQPFWLKLALALSAGFFEEVFFRGLLQPRVGIAASTALFVLAHAGYQQPVMLVTLLPLSLLFSALVRWRQNVWPAIVAHFLFDLGQLTVVVPTVLRLVPGGNEAAPAP
jgi:membrane protease YdiL (CAAX protease family)